MPARRRLEAATDLLARARALRSEVRRDLETKLWGADDIQMDAYNDMANNLAFLFPDDPVLTTLILMPDAILQSYGPPWNAGPMPNDLPSRRLDARLTRLINGLESVLGVASDEDPPARAAGQVLSETSATNKVEAQDWDLFICHASEDKESFVRGLANALREHCTVWYDESTLQIGDSLRRKIDEGLARSRFGVVVLSPNFFAKKWPQNELDGLAARERDGRKVILPVWLDIDEDGVAEHSPMLAGRYAAKAHEGLDVVVEKILDAMEPQ